MKKVFRDYKQMVDLFTGCKNNLITEFQSEINYTVKEFINEHTEEELIDLITILVTNQANNYKVRNMRLNYDNYKFEKSL